jgi:hypothetical protein
LGTSSLLSHLISSFPIVYVTEKQDHESVTGKSHVLPDKDQFLPILVKKFFRAISPEIGAATGINTGLVRPPDPHQLNNPEDEDRDGLRNVGIYESRTTLPG